MPPNVDLISDSDWICDVLTDISDTLMTAGYDITPKLLFDCRLALVLEANKLRDAREISSGLPQCTDNRAEAAAKMCLV